jgi:hypothetical protein
MQLDRVDQGSELEPPKVLGVVELFEKLIQIEKYALLATSPHLI